MVEKYQPLYLKYRPQSLADLVGQKAVAQTLTNAIDHDRICHAYLFTGPRGTGKTSSARILAKSLNCEKGPTAAPCLVCTQCVEIRDAISPAVFELDAASNNSVDDARSLIERAPLVAQGGRYKVYIIDECHMLTKEAFNALLKTIEEPPDKVIFILATTEEHKVPPTIISRCQRLMFRLVNQVELKEHLRNVAAKESINIEEDALELVARRSAGGLRDALGLLDQASLLSTPTKPVGVTDLLALMGAVQEDVLLQISASVKANDGSVVLKSVQALLLDGREPAVVVQELAKHFLNLAKACYNTDATNAIGEHTILGSALYLEGLAKQAKDFTPAEIAQIVELLDKLEQTVRRSSQGSLNLEMGLLSICHRHDIVLYKEVSERLANVEAAMSGAVDFVAPATAKPAGEKYAKPAAPVQAPAAVQAPASVAAAVPAPPAPVAQSTRPEIVMGDDDEDDERERESERQAEREEQPAPVAAAAAAQISSREAPSDLAMCDDDDVEPEARPQPKTLVATAGGAPSADGAVGANELGVSLDEFWQDLKDAVQKKSIPTNGQLQAYAFILSFENSEVVIGVRKEMYQRMIEGKAALIKTAAKELLNREVNIRVKVVGEGEPAPAVKAPAASSSRPAVSREQHSPTNNSQEPDRAQASQQRSNNGNANATNSAPTERPRPAAPPASQPAAALNAPSRVTTSNDFLPPEQNLLKEAYKLFEGPGSRLIG